MKINPIVEPPPPVTSKRINKLLGQALLKPETLTDEEVREIASSVLFHVLSQQQAPLTDASAGEADEETE